MSIVKRETMKIGQRIKEVFDAMPKSCTVNWFADQIHCDRRNVYRLFHKDNIDIELLLIISKALNHNFFEDLSEELRQSMSQNETMEDTASE